jgi:uncharacterized protein YeeX (DUF496 family)
MPTEVWRPGDFRVCPKCGSRHKVQDIKCSRCGTVLVGAPVHHATPVAVQTSAMRSSPALRALLVGGLLVAVGAGLWVRSVFRGAALQDSVQAANASAPPAPAAQPTWTPPVLSYPPMVGYNTGVRPGAVAMVGASATAAVDSAGQGMTSIAPPSEPTRKTTFTNEDLEHARGAVSSPAVSATAVAGAPAVATRATVDTSDDAAREWVSRVRDDEEKVRDAQARVRRLQAQAEALRTQAAAVSDPDARAKVQRDLSDTLDDLEKAERKLAEKQRDLDDTKDKARSAGAKF